MGKVVPLSVSSDSSSSPSSWRFARIMRFYCRQDKECATTTFGPSNNRSLTTLLNEDSSFGKRRALRYFQITKGTAPEAQADSWYIMTDISGDLLQLPRLYSLRNWIEYGFKQVKSELGWADFRVTDYASIERWTKKGCIALQLL